MRKFRIAELYAGTARSVEPFRSWRRVDIAMLADANAYARDTYLLNFPNAPYAKRSISRLGPEDVTALADGRIDVLLACPPCQGFSESGLRDSQDPRNWHVRKFARLALGLKPLAVVMENVPTVAASPEFTYLTRLLEQADYKGAAIIANAAQYGSTQTRQRLLFVAFRSDVGVQPKFPTPRCGGTKQVFSYAKLAYARPSEDPVGILGVTPAAQRLAASLSQNMSQRLGSAPMTTVQETLTDLPRVGTFKARELNHLAWDHTPALLRRMDRVAEGHQWRGGTDHFQHSYARLHRKGLARTITTFFPYAGSGRFWHPTANW